MRGSGNSCLFDNVVAVVSPVGRIRSNSEGVVAGAEKRGKGREGEGEAPHKKVDADTWGWQVGNFLLGSSKYEVRKGRVPSKAVRGCDVKWILQHKPEAEC